MDKFIKLNPCLGPLCCTIEVKISKMSWALRNRELHSGELPDDPIEEFPSTPTKEEPPVEEQTPVEYYDSDSDSEVVVHYHACRKRQFDDWLQRLQSRRALVQVVQYWALKQLQFKKWMQEVKSRPAQSNRALVKKTTPQPKRLKRK